MLVEAVEALHERLRDYIEAAYHIADPRLLRQRQQLLDKLGVLRQPAFIESTRVYAKGRRFGEFLSRFNEAERDKIGGLIARLANREPPLVYESSLRAPAHSRRGPPRREERGGLHRDGLRQDRVLHHPAPHPAPARGDLRAGIVRRARGPGDRALSDERARQRPAQPHPPLARRRRCRGRVRAGRQAAGALWPVHGPHAVLRAARLHRRGGRRADEGVQGLLHGYRAQAGGGRRRGRPPAAPGAPRPRPLASETPAAGVVRRHRVRRVHALVGGPPPHAAR